MGCSGVVDRYGKRVLGRLEGNIGECDFDKEEVHFGNSEGGFGNRVGFEDSFGFGDFEEGSCDIGCSGSGSSGDKEFGGRSGNGFVEGKRQQLLHFLSSLAGLTFSSDWIGPLQFSRSLFLLPSPRPV